MYVVLLGLPGAGKGTQAARLKDETGLAHITTGELFRENIRQGTELGKKAQEFVDGGTLVPDEITIGMLLDRMKADDCQGGAMFDGFPRNTVQARVLDEALEAQEKQIDKAIYIRAGQEELVSRLAGRWSCPNCGAVYHEMNQPPKTAGVCDNCGSQLTQRSDDRPDVVRTRLEVNAKNLQPLLDYYGQQGKLSEVDGERELDAIAADLKRLIQS
ncbi:MAG: adenylate kinase [Chloroflexota bacterium]